MKDLALIQSLVGNTISEHLKYVDCYVGGQLGLFIPSVGFCQYAIKQHHTHPSYSFVLLPTPNDNIIKTDLVPDSNSYVASMIAPDVPHHEVQSECFVRYFAIMIAAPLVHQRAKQFGIHLKDCPSQIHFLVSKNILELLTRFMDEYDSHPNDNAILDALSLLITNELIQAAFQSRPKQSAAADGFIQNAVDSMHQTYAANHTVLYYAKQANQSVSLFSHSFKRELGVSPAAFLAQLRIKNAMKLLRNTDASMVDIAMQCGFSSASHFSANFQKQYGTSPTKYRKLFQNL